jgi:hypothetical protein
MLHSQNKTWCNWSADENIVSTMFERHSLKNGRVFCNRSKFLGEYLTWKNRINSVIKQIIRSTGIITKIRHYTNLNTLKLIYYALVYPCLTYGNLPLGCTYPTRIQKLFNLQRKIIRLISFNSYFDHTK